MIFSFYLVILEIIILKDSVYKGIRQPFNNTLHY